jgi:hypothetical protein
VHLNVRCFSPQRVQRPRSLRFSHVGWSTHGAGGNLERPPWRFGVSRLLLGCGAGAVSRPAYGLFLSLPPLVPCFSAVDAGCGARLSRLGFTSTSCAFSNNSSTVSNCPLFPAKSLILALIPGCSPDHTVSYSIRCAIDSSSPAFQPASRQFDCMWLASAFTVLLLSTAARTYWAYAYADASGCRPRSSYISRISASNKFQSRRQSE